MGKWTAGIMVGSIVGSIAFASLRLGWVGGDGSLHDDPEGIEAWADDRQYRAANPLTKSERRAQARRAMIADILMAGGAAVTFGGAVVLAEHEQRRGRR